MDRRAEASNLKLQLLGLKDTPEVRLMLRYLEVQLELAKDRLVTCNLHDFPVFQGEARALENLIRDMTRRPQLATQTTA